MRSSVCRQHIAKNGGSLEALARRVARQHPAPANEILRHNSSGSRDQPVLSRRGHGGQLDGAPGADVLPAALHGALCAGCDHLHHAGVYWGCCPSHAGLLSRAGDLHHSNHQDCSMIVCIPHFTVFKV